MKPGQRLPDVISWLDPEMRATPRRAGGGPAALRPPGAVAEPAFLAACTRCGDCAAACPEGAIRAAPENLREIAGTPIVDPITAACALCEDLPCIGSCETGALRPEAPAVLGTAHVQVMDCLNRLSSTCSVCVERCPVPGAMAFVDGVPRVEPALCTGCGRCQHLCPAPTNAVLMLPNLDRPTPEALDRLAAKDAAARAEAEARSDTDAKPAIASGADGEDALVLPELHESLLDETGLRDLFRDLAALARIDEVRLKQGPRDRAGAGAQVSIDEALELLLAGRVRGVQIRYGYAQDSWCDTILQAPGGHRVVRMADAVRPSSHA